MLCRAKKLQFAESWRSAGLGRVLFFTSSSLCTKGWTPNILFYPHAATFFARTDPVDRVHAWHLSSENPLFRRETNEKLPRQPSVFSNTLPPSSNAPRSRQFYPSHFFSPSPASFTPSCPHVRLNQKFFFRPALRLLNCLARSISPLHLVNSAPDSASLYATFIYTIRKCIRLVCVHAKLFYVI